MVSLDDRPHVRPSLTPAAVAFVGGLLLHAVEQALFLRAGPLPALVTAPVVATLAYLRFQPTTYRGVVALTVWGVLSSAGGVALLYLATVNYTLPRVMTEWEMVAYDLGLFCWFVLSLAGVYVLAARMNRRERLVLSLAPVVQGAFAVTMRLLVATGIYA